MTYNKKSIAPILLFIVWSILLATVCLVGITNVLADTVPSTLTYSSSVEQQLYNTGKDNWVSCTNNSCSLWGSSNSGVPSWLSYTFKSSLKTGYTYFFDISIQFNYSNNSNSSIPVWKLSNYVNEGDNYSGRINRDMISCSNAQLSISNNTEIATWNCSFSPKQDYNDFEFYLWTNKNYDSLSNNGVFMPYNNSTYKLNSYKLSYLDGSTGTLITQNQQIIQQQKEQNETSKGILGKIKDILSYINPFSENFFAYKLVELIINGLKSLFIPSDDFFSNWWNDFKSFMEAKLGFLTKPIDIFITFISSYLNLSEDNIIINIPNITVPNFEDNILIHAQTFNWKELLQSKTSFNNLWQLYLDFVDVFLIFNFIGLCEGVYARIFGGDTSNYEYYTVEDSYYFDSSTGEVAETGKHSERTVTKRKKV